MTAASPPDRVMPPSIPLIVPVFVIVAGPPVTMTALPPATQSSPLLMMPALVSTLGRPFTGSLTN